MYDDLDETLSTHYPKCERFIDEGRRIYCKKLDQPSLQAARKYFIAWMLDITESLDLQLQGSAQGLTVDLNEWDFTPYGTPYSTPCSEKPAARRGRDPHTSELRGSSKKNSSL